MERLRQTFKDLKISKNTLYNFVRKDCNLTLKKACFQPIKRNSEEKIHERLEWVRKWETTDMDFYNELRFS
jgi:plasmid replication initiation protein